MSEINDIVESKIKVSKSNHAFQIPNNYKQKYLFELIINYNNINTKKVFRKVEDNIKTNLISIHDKINYRTIHNFKLFIYTYHYINTTNNIFEDMIDSSIELCNITGTIDHSQFNYIQSNNKVFIEFSQTTNEFTNCNCIYNENDNNDFFSLCISPP